MSALFATVLVASLAGSLHCVAMCGPLIGLAGSARTLRLALLHAAGRLATYVTLGVLAGVVGRAIDLAGRVGDVQRAATVVAAVTIFGWAAYAIVTAVRARRPVTRVAPTAQVGALRGWLRGKSFQNGLVHIRTRRPGLRAYLVGVLTGLLPCGWLWAFVVSAAGTGNPITGGLVMAAFWLGTVPAMTGVLALGGSLLVRLRQRMPVITAAALLALGLGTLAVRWPNAGASGVAHPSCHDPGAKR